MAERIPITVANGDGIGPEIMAATLRILEAAEAPLEIETIDIGEKVYLAGNSSGIEPSSWESLRRTKVFLKAPITTPQGGGYKSLNVTVRKVLGLYANVRPCVAYHPFVETKHPVMDVVIVRENEEDLYAGIEHRQTNQVVQCLKLISRPGSEKIIRYAFEYARRNSRKKVTCFTKDNIMKLTDGLFHKIFDEIASEYSDLENEHWIVDIGAAKLADTPEAFDVVVMPNLYGADCRVRRFGRFGEHRRERFDVRSDSWFGAAACGTEPCESVRLVAGRGDDVGPCWFDRSRRTSSQRVAAYNRRRYSYLRHLRRTSQQTEGRHA
jgi:isocitrate dehydrogenase